MTTLEQVLSTLWELRLSLHHFSFDFICLLLYAGCSCLFSNGSLVVVYKLTFTDARNMPNNAADVLKKLRDIVQNGTLGDYQLDKSADVCLVDISTGQCLPVSSEMMTFATSMSLFTESQDMITQSPISPNAFESSSNLMMSIFESSVSLQPSDSSQMAHISSLSMIPDVPLSSP